MNGRTPEEYVSENHDQLVRIIKHSSDEFVRALAIAALIEYADDPTRESVRRDLERFLEESE